MPTTKKREIRDSARTGTVSKSAAKSAVLSQKAMSSHKTGSGPKTVSSSNSKVNKSATTSPFSAKAPVLRRKK